MRLPLDLPWEWLLALLTASPFAARLLLWDTEGRPIAVVPYRVTGRSVTGTVRVTFAQSDSSGTERLDSSWTVSGGTPDGTDGAATAGVIVMRRALTMSSWRLRATDAEGRDVAAIGGDGQAARDDGNITMSDLVLGATRNSATWIQGEHRIPILVSDTIMHGDTLHLTYQVRSDTARARVRTTLTFTNVTDPKAGIRIVQGASDGAVMGGVNWFTRDVDLSTLPSGRYLIELQVGDLDGGGSSVRPARFVIR